MYSYFGKKSIAFFSIYDIINMYRQIYHFFFERGDGFMKTVFITGASGLIGTAVSETLLAKGCKVIGVDNLPNSNIDNPNYSFVQTALDNKDAVTQALNDSKADALIHLGCSVDNDFPNLITSEQEKMASNVDKYLYKAAVSAGVSDIILLSTHQVYAVQKTREPVREAADEKPITAYGKLKLDSEKTLTKATKGSSVKCVIARVCPIYTKMYPHNLHAKIYDPKDNCAYIYGYGDYGFSFCCLYNFVDFVVGILSAGGANYQGVYNICDTKPILAKEIVEFERAFHKLGAVVQRNYGADAIKSALAFAAKTAKTDYRYNDMNTVCSNISYDNTKAQRISTFRWKLTNTK